MSEVRNKQLNSLIGKARFYRRVIKPCRIFFFAYAFISFVFWFLNCLETDWLYMFEWLFIVPYRIVAMFYRPQGISVDFTLAIIGCISLVFGFALDYVINNNYENIVEKIKQEELKIKRANTERKKTTKRTSPTGEKIVTSRYGLEEPKAYENPKLLFLIMPRVKKIKKTQNDMELTFKEVDLVKQKINKKLLDDLSYSKPLQKGYYKKNLFLLYNDFNFTDDFIYYLKPTIVQTISAFKKYGIKVSFCFVFSVINDITILENELDCMDTVLSLNFAGEYIVTDRFKLAYSARNIQKYKMEPKGEYNLSKNLSITNNRPLYVLKTEGTNKNES